MRETRAAIADNLRAVFPGRDRTRRSSGARATRSRAYARDVIDFIRALARPDGRRAGALRLLARGRAAASSICWRRGAASSWSPATTATGRSARSSSGASCTCRSTIVAMAGGQPGGQPAAPRDSRPASAPTRSRSAIARHGAADSPPARRRTASSPMLMDRHLGRDRVDVQLLGRRAWFLRTPALMAFMTGAPLVPCFIERIGPGASRSAPARRSSSPANGRATKRSRRAAQDFADQLSARVRAAPAVLVSLLPLLGRASTMRSMPPRPVGVAHGSADARRRRPRRRPRRLPGRTGRSRGPRRGGDARRAFAGHRQRRGALRAGIATCACISSARTRCRRASLMAALYGGRRPAGRPGHAFRRRCSGPRTAGAMSHLALDLASAR